MQVTRETIKQEIDQFDDTQLKQVAEFIEFIKFRRQFQRKITDLHQFASLYQEFSQEDRELATGWHSRLCQPVAKRGSMMTITRGEVWLANLNPSRRC